MLALLFKHIQVVQGSSIPSTGVRIRHVHAPSLTSVGRVTLFYDAMSISPAVYSFFDYREHYLGPKPICSALLPDDLVATSVTRRSGSFEGDISRALHSSILRCPFSRPHPSSRHQAKSLAAKSIHLLRDGILGRAHNLSDWHRIRILTRSDRSIDSKITSFGRK